MFAAVRAAPAMELASVNDGALRGGTLVDRLPLSTRDALEWATINGANACGLPRKIGTLTAGGEADFITIRTGAVSLAPLNNPVGQPVLSAPVGNADGVFVAGKAVKRNGEFTHVDLARLRRQATQARHYGLERGVMGLGFGFELIPEEKQKA